VDLNDPLNVRLTSLIVGEDESIPAISASSRLLVHQGLARYLLK
jgi:hypothetical protein